MHCLAGEKRQPDSLNAMNFTASSAKRTTASVAAGLTVAGAAAVGISAPAQAASVETWDRLAQCESGGDPTAIGGGGRRPRRGTRRPR